MGQSPSHNDNSNAPAGRVRNRAPNSTFAAVQEWADLKQQREGNVFGAKIVSCIHNMIHIEGPAYFVRFCIDRTLSESHLEYEHVDNFGWFRRYFLSCLFLLVIPCWAPWLFATFMMSHNFHFMQVTGGDYVMGNVEVNVSQLQRAMLRSQNISSGAVHLTDQNFQDQISQGQHQSLLGALTIILFFLLATLRHVGEHSRFVKKYYIMRVLHFSWLSPEFPRLQYTGGTLFSKKLKLYKLVPCAWLATIMSFVVVFPAVAVLSKHDFSLLHDVLPPAFLAAFAFSKIYMLAANALFFHWLSSETHYSIVQRHFTAHLMYPALLQHMQIFTVTREEMQLINESPSMQLAVLQYAGLLKNPIETFASMGEGDFETQQKQPGDAEMEGLVRAGEHMNLDSNDELQWLAKTEWMLKQIYVMDNRGYEPYERIKLWVSEQSGANGVTLLGNLQGAMGKSPQYGYAEPGFAPPALSIDEIRAAKGSAVHGPIRIAAAPATAAHDSFKVQGAAANGPVNNFAGWGSPENAGPPMSPAPVPAPAALDLRVEGSAAHGPMNPMPTPVAQIPSAQFAMYGSAAH